jgi:hypothetical protein
MYVQGLAIGVLVTIGTQSASNRFEQDSSLRIKYGVVLRTTVAELVALEIWINLRSSSVGRLPPVPPNVTAVCANVLPSIVLPTSITMAEPAMIVPLKAEYVPSVAWVPTCQKMFLACAPPARKTLLLRPASTFSAVAIWKIQTSSGPPVSVRSASYI